jgi:hypothetical protein
MIDMIHEIEDGRRPFSGANLVELAGVSQPAGARSAHRLRPVQ